VWVPVLLMLSAVHGCRPAAPIPPASALAPAAAPDMTDPGNPRTLVQALDRSIRYLSHRDPDRRLFLSGETVTVGRQIATLKDFRSQVNRFGLGPALFRHLENRYVFYGPRTNRVLVTGYFETEIQGSLTPGPEYRHPVYRTPQDLHRVDTSGLPLLSAVPFLPPRLVVRLDPQGRMLPYPTRADIDGARPLAGRGLELFWARDPIALFFLHVQGSGRVRLQNGTTRRLGFAGHNGHPYYPIGRELIRRGLIDPDAVSMQAIREVLRSHPGQAREIMNTNPRYIFFDWTRRGPFGAGGVILTPYRSIAADPSQYPPGSLCFLSIPLPFTEDGERPAAASADGRFSGFVLTQDTGSAISGPARLDLFTGSGTESEWVAGHMRQEGTVTLILKKPG